MSNRGFKFSAGTTPTFLLAVLLVLAVVTGGGCLRTGERRETVRVGVFIPLTGSTADYGTSSLNGFRMAAEELNTSGGVLGRQIELMLEDTRSDAQETEVVVQRLITERGAHALLGEVVSSRSLIAARIAQKARVPMLTPSSTSVDVTRAGDYIFRSCYTDPFQAAALARFASEGLRARRAALLVDRTESYSSELASLISEAFARRGGQIVSEQGYAAGDEDFTPQLMQIGADAPEVLFVPGYYREAGLIAKRAKELGIDAPLVGGDGWGSPGLSQIGGESLHGSFFSNHFSVNDQDTAVRTFVEDYISMYGYMPDAFAATAYDAARIMFYAVRDAGTTDPARLRDALAATYYRGITGTVSFDRDRNAVKPIIIIRIETGGVHAVQERLMPQPLRAQNASPRH